MKRKAKAIAWGVVMILACSVVLLGVYSCAKKTSPEGGPYDMTPPKLLRSTPTNGEVNVKKRTLKLRFDENVKLERQSEKVVFSPPQRVPPKITAGVGKTITIRFEEELLDSTTYVIDFSDAIVDLNEGNPIDGFTFAFSTGPVIDSMMLRGKVIDARTLQPLPDITVGIYKDFQEEDLQKKTMLRITRSTETGNFAIHHLAPAEYTLFGIDDIDRSYNYTGASEGLAFLLEKVEANPFVEEENKLQKQEESISPIDTLSSTEKKDNQDGKKETDEEKLDSVEGNAEALPKDANESLPLSASEKSTSTDTLNLSNGQKADSTETALPAPDSLATGEVKFVAEYFTSHEPKPDHLLLFSRPMHKAQKLQRATRPDSVSISLFFTEPLDELPELKLLSSSRSMEETHRWELNESRTELLYWIVDSSLYRQDSLAYQLTYATTDSLRQKISKVDTLKLFYRDPSKSQSIRKKSIFAQWREKRKAKKPEKEALQKAKSDALLQRDSSRMEDNQPDSLARTAKSNLPTDEPKVASDSLAVRKKPLELRFAEQNPLRRGYPEEPLYLEFSEVPSKIDTTHIHLYSIKVDSLAQVSLPSQQHGEEEEEEAVERRRESTNRTDKNASLLGGASNPYESGIDRYDNPPEEDASLVGEADSEAPAEQSGKATPPATGSSSIQLPPGERIAIPYQLLPHPTHARRMQLQFDAQFGTYYLLEADSLAIEGAYGAELPHTELPFKVEEESSFGSLHLKLDSLLHDSPATFELLNEADSVLLHCSARDTIRLDNLLPNTYFARVWFDLNENGVWDEASYPNRMPEPTYYYPKELKVQPKFTQRILWQLDALPLYEQRPENMKKVESKKKEEKKRERRNLNEEYVARMKERYGEKWNPTNRDRRMLGMPSRKEERESKKASESTEEAANSVEKTTKPQQE